MGRWRWRVRWGYAAIYLSICEWCPGCVVLVLLGVVFCLSNKRNLYFYSMVSKTRPTCWR